MVVVKIDYNLLVLSITDKNYDEKSKIITILLFSS